MHWCVHASQGKLVAMFGVPDMGRVCTDTHFPNFLQNVRSLASLFEVAKYNLSGTNLIAFASTHWQTVG